MLACSWCNSSRTYLLTLSGRSSSGATPMAAPTSRSLRLDTRLLRAAERRASLVARGSACSRCCEARALSTWLGSGAESP